MGFRVNSYATVWSVESVKPNVTKVQLSTSRKNRQTGEYEKDFGGFCRFVGNCAVDALNLRKQDRIKLLEVDVTNQYDAQAKREWVYYTVFSFEKVDQNGGAKQAPTSQPAVVEENPVEAEDSGLPF